MSGDEVFPEDGFGDDLADYLNIYVDETAEQLDDLVETMLDLEQQPGDRDLLGNAFRLLHSMKGASGMMGLDQIKVLT
ncbi:MAG: Hpt domain-containing protein, partial [Planctomycetota bacterium]